MAKKRKRTERNAATEAEEDGDTGNDANRDRTEDSARRRGDDEQFRCSICGDTFNSRTQRRQHIHRKHGSFAE